MGTTKKVMNDTRRHTKLPKNDYHLEKKSKPHGAILNKHIASSQTREKLTIQYTKSKASKLLSKHLTFARTYKTIQYDFIIIE